MGEAYNWVVSICLKFCCRSLTLSITKTLKPCLAMDSSWLRSMWNTAAPEATGRVMRNSDMRSSARIPPPSSLERWVVGLPLKWCWTELWSSPSWSVRDSLTLRTSSQKSKSWKRVIRSRRSTTAKLQDAPFCSRLHAGGRQMLDLKSHRGKTLDERTIASLSWKRVRQQLRNCRRSLDNRNQPAWIFASSLTSGVENSPPSAFILDFSYASVTTVPASIFQYFMVGLWTNVRLLLSLPMAQKHWY